jgi:probable rRNA maturation factor
MILIRKSVAGVTAAMLARFLGRARRVTGVAGEVTVLVASSAELRRLNRQFRGQDHPTDVLSFPTPSQHAKTGRDGDIGRDGYLGDIAISADLAHRSAKLLGHGPAAEIKVLILHGLLHLAGYDHESDGGAMARRELRLRRQLKLPEALTERAAGMRSASVPAGGARRPEAGATTSQKRHAFSSTGARRSRKR